MKNPTYMTDEDRWQAVLARDTRADEQFVFAVQTTGIVCRPSCRARHALRKNVHFYPDVHHAVQAGFRPCKRCRPDKRDPQEEKLAKVERACRLLEQDPALTLEMLAQQVAMSPFHFHRLFKSVTGMTPKAWQQAARGQRLRNALAHGDKITDAVLAAGFPDSSSYYRKANDALGMTAKQYRKGDVAVRYAISECALGRCLVGESERGICAILLGDDDAKVTQEILSDVLLRLSIPSITVACRWLCRWIFAEPLSSSRSGRPCAIFPAVKQPATSRWRRRLANLARYVRWPQRVPQINWRSSSLAIVLYARTERFRAIAGGRNERRYY